MKKSIRKKPPQRFSWLRLPEPKKLEPAVAQLQKESRERLG